jgi:DNA polymerase-3 subunit alpha
MMVKFADYGFNKSHSAAYAYVAYQTAYLKANYPAEFLAANMTNEASDQAKVVRLIDECRSFSVKVLPPDINHSAVHFSVDPDGQIVFGMAAIRNVGQSAVQEILSERERKGPFASIFDFTRRLGGSHLINKRLLEHLVLSGAFDSLHPNRRQCYQSIDSAVGYGGAWAEQRASGMDSLFSITGAAGEESMIPEPTMPVLEEWPNIERLNRERSVLDFYVSGHPLDEFSIEAENLTQIRFGELPEEIDPKVPIRVCGVVSSVRTKLDRRENQFAIVGIEDFTGKAECIFWSDAWRRNASMVTEGAMIVVVGRPEVEGADSLRIVADEVIPMTQALAKFARGVAVNVALDRIPPDAHERVEQLFREHRGDMQCIFRIYDSQGALRARYAARGTPVSPTRELIDGLNEIFRAENVRLFT